MKKLRVVSAALAAVCAMALMATEAEAYTARQQASINVAQTYAYNTMRMTGFTVDFATQDGTLVGATCWRTVTVNGRTTTTRYSVLFSIAALPPARGQTVGQLYVSRVVANQIP